MAERSKDAGSSKTKIKIACLLIVLSLVLLPNFSTNVYAPAPQQPSTFFLHKQNSKTINTVTTTLWANTTQYWASSTQTEQRPTSNSVPGVWDFYTEPAMAGNVTFTGPLTFLLYFSSSSSTGTGTVITGTLSKITSSGTKVALAVASLSNAPISSSITAYTLTILSNTYQVEAGAIFDFTITVTIPGSTTRTITLYYDSPLYRSQVSVTFQSRTWVASFTSQNQTGVQTGFFSRNWTSVARQVTIKAVVFDALGLYDLAVVEANVTAPSGSNLITNTPMMRTQGTDQDFSGLWSLNVTYATTDPSGMYSSSLRVLDNSGISMNMQLSYTIFAQWFLNLRAVSLDSAPVPVAGAAVTLFVGAVPVYTGTSNASGWVSPANILLRDNVTYSIKGFWQGSLVNQTLSYSPRSSQSILLYLSVYTVDFSGVFRDGNGNSLPQPPSSFLLAYPNGSVVSGNTGVQQLPAGTYSISSVVWKGVDVTPATAIFNPKNGIPSLDLQIYDVTILVVDQEGSAIPGAAVTLTLGGQTIAQGTTGTDGVLVLRGLPKGQYIVQADSQSQTTKSTLDLNQNVSNKLQLSTGASWIQSFGWILLVGAALGATGGWIGYRQISRSLAYKEESFDYLDKITGGGFRNGEVVLIEGDAGAGKTTMCEQLAHRSLAAGDPVIFLTYDNPEKIRESMRSFSWDPSHDEAKRFQLVGCELSAPQTTRHGFGMIDSFYDITVLNINIATALDQVGSGKPTIIIDSLNELSDRANLNSLANLVMETSGRVSGMQGKLFLTVSRSISKTVLGRLEDTVDSIIEFSPVVEAGRTFSDLRVKKMKGRKPDNRPVRIRVDSRKGIVFQLHRAIHPKLMQAPKAAPTHKS